MDIKFNNKLISVSKIDISLKQFLADNYDLKKWDVAILNGSPHKKEELNIKLKNNDEVSIVSFFGGG